MRTFLRCVAALVALLTACVNTHVGREFHSARELHGAFAGFAPIGTFDVGYPARIVEVVEGTGTLQLVHGHTPHRYEFPTPVALRAVVVEHGGGRGVLVLRGELGE